MADSSHTASSDLLGAHRSVLEAMSAAPRTAMLVGALGDEALLELMRVAAAERRLADALVAVAAGEIARRSEPALGSEGLSRRHGCRTAELLVQRLSSATKSEANRDVRVGRVTADPEATPDDPRAWLAPVRDAVEAGELSVAKAAAIVDELGTPEAAVTAEQLGAAAAELVTVATTPAADGLPDGLDADAVRRTAREARNALDLEGVEEREAALRAKRSLRLFRQDDGTVRLVWVMDPLTAAAVTSLYDRGTSPRRGGPRFIDPHDAARADAVLADARSTEQLASDVFEQLLRLGSAHPDDLLLTSTGTALKILVTTDTLDGGVGAGYLDGSGAEVSLGTIEAALCNGTNQRIDYDTDGGPLDVGREQRLFTRRQREAVSAMWGGCAMPGCERPPSWTELHHAVPWSEGGATDIRQALPLCRVHHLDLHNRHWTLTRSDAQNWLLQLEPGTPPFRLEPKSPAWRELRSRHREHTQRPRRDAAPERRDAG